MRLWSSFSPSLSALVPFVQHMKFLFLATQALIRSFSSSLYHHPSAAVVLSSFALLLLASVINFPALSSVLCGWLKLCLLRTSVMLLWLYWYIYMYIYLYIYIRINESQFLCCLWGCCSYPKTSNLCCRKNPILLPWKGLSLCVCCNKEEWWSSF